MAVGMQSCPDTVSVLFALVCPPTVTRWSLDSLGTMLADVLDLVDLAACTC